MATSVTEVESFTPDNWQTGSNPIETTSVSVKVGQVIAAREVLAMETTTGKVVTYSEGGSNGTNVPVYISAYAIDATAAEQKAQVLKAGTFNPELVVWSGTPTDAQKDAAFAGTPISLQLPQE